MSTSLADNAVTTEELVLRWQVHLAKRDPRRLAGVIAAVVGISLLGFVWFGGNVIPVIVFALVVLGTLSDFVLPVTYTITSTRVTATTLVGKSTMAWKDVKKCYLEESGVKLSPLSRQSRLEAYRGVYLRFGENREEVLEAVRRLRPAQS